MKNKKIVALAALAVISVASLTLFQNTRRLKAPLLEVQPRTIAKTFQESGEILPAVEYPVYGLQGGLVTQVAVEEGQLVDKGDLLAMVEETELKFQLSQLEAQLKSLRGEEAQTEQSQPSEIKSQELAVKQAELDLENYREDLERAQKLYDEGAITRTELDNIQKVVETAEINLELQEQALVLLRETDGSRQFFSGRADALQAQIDLLKYKIEKCRILSPIEGVVADLSIHQGDLLTPGIRLMKIFQRDKYLMEVYVPADEARELCAGLTVRILRDGRNKGNTYEGTIEKIAPSAEEKISALGLAEQRVKVTVLPSVHEGARWYPGTKLDVEFTTDSRENVLAVPKTALFSYEKGDALWTVKDGKAKIQPVETGFENDLEVVVTGLAPGDVIITNPQLAGLEEGKKIQGI